jgi:hypothetical protein
VLLDWSAGLLQASGSVTGPWQVVPGATPPWPVSSQAPSRFYKAIVP